MCIRMSEKYNWYSKVYPGDICESLVSFQPTIPPQTQWSEINRCSFSKELTLSYCLFSGVRWWVTLPNWHKWSSSVSHLFYASSPAFWFPGDPYLHQLSWLLEKWAVRHSCSWFKSNRKPVIYTAWYSAGCVLPLSLVVAPLHCHSFAFVPVETDWGRTVNIIALRFILLYFYFLCVYVYMCVSHECTSAPGDRGCWIPWIWR